jgi:hypothetical protein
MRQTAGSNNEGGLEEHRIHKQNETPTPEEVEAKRASDADELQSLSAPTLDLRRFENSNSLLRHLLEGQGD